MNIFVIPSNYRNHDNPQANIFVQQQCEALRHRGHKITVLDSTSVGIRSWFSKKCFVPYIRLDNDEMIYTLCIWGFMQKRFPFFADFQYNFKIRKLYKLAVKNEGKPDILYGHFSFPSGKAAVKLGKKYHIPVAVEEHGGMYMTDKINKYNSKVLAMTMLGADKFFCVSTAHKEALRNYSGVNKDIEVVPNMIHPSYRFVPVPDRKEFIFFAGGNLKPNKCFDMLICSFVKAFGNNGNVFLRIAGEGSEREKLQQMIKAYHMEDRITLVGRLSTPEMAKEYENCNAFALPSEHESFGIVYREAMATGRPVVSTRNGGIEEGWNDSFGYLTPLGDIDKFAEAMGKMYENYSEFDLEQISKDTLSVYSEETIVDIIENILKNTATDYHA